MENFRVLVVDDEADFLETIVKRLKKRGLDAEGVPSGEAAIDLMKERRSDVILLDIKMPGGMDGIEVFRELKRIQPLAEVIFLTGHATLESSIEGMKLGAFDYLIKPVQLEVLLPKLAEAFEKKNAHEQKIRNYKIQELIRHPGKIFDLEKDDRIEE
jgi:DNA-binding NtrC family response regulator